jgi:antitoxin HicB
MKTGELTYTVVLVREADGGYSVHIPALKGCHTQGDDLAEALWMARDAIQGYLAVLEEDGECLPPDVNTVAFDWGDAQEALVYRIRVREEAPVA